MKLISAPRTGPIQKHEEAPIDGVDTKRVISLCPEAFRVLFYFGFVAVAVITMAVTGIWGEVDCEATVCVTCDFPHFSYFSSALWIPNVFLIVIHLVHDFFRIDDGLKEGELGSTFYRCFCAVAMFEVFLQITATSLEGEVFLRIFAFFIITFAQWTLAFMRLVWFLKMNVLEHYAPCYVYGWRIYVVLMLLVVVGKTLVSVPNLFGAPLWTPKGLEWMATYSMFNDRLYIFLTVICPAFIDLRCVASDIQPVVLLIDRGMGENKCSTIKKTAVGLYTLYPIEKMS